LTVSILCVIIFLETFRETFPEIIQKNSIQMSRKKTNITIKDVAKAAGVSISTVSRVLNGKDYISEETQERVRAVIEQLGFSSSLAARSMRSRRKNLIGLVIPDLGFPYSIEVVKGINRAIGESDFDLLVYTMGDMRKSGPALRYISLLNNAITDGVIIVGYEASNIIADSTVVAVDPPEFHPTYPSVRCTNYQGGLDAVRYLLSLGHRRIAYIGTKPEPASLNQRFTGYKDGLLEAGVPLDESLVLYSDLPPEVAGKKCARELLSIETSPTAIMAGTDQIALGVLQAAQETGLRVPDDLSVIGFDNIPEAKCLGLTTIDHPLVEIGYMATQMLFKLIRNEKLDQQIVEMPTSLVIRNTCRDLRQT
jgi:LacI family transcriptional regulator